LIFFNIQTIQAFLNEKYFQNYYDLIFINRKETYDTFIAIIRFE
jgi:hypothetical protein